MIKCEKDRKISNVAEDGEEHSMIWNVYAVPMESAVFMGKLPEQLSLHCDHDGSHTQTNVRHICEISGRAR